MKGQDFNGGVGIGGIVKILMEGRGLRLPEIKEMFSEYVGETRKFVREQPCRESSKKCRSICRHHTIRSICTKIPMVR